MRKKIQIPEKVRPILKQIGEFSAAQDAVAYAVGGCVRDWCLGVSNTPDLDITVEGNGIAVAEALADALDVSVRIHRAFGTATIILKGSQDRRIDFASARTETYKFPAAYPKVRSGTLKDDLARRDFTINAMGVALHPDQFGMFLDPFGGLEDLSRKRLKVLHPRSFLDDPSRILRGIRFAQRFNMRFDSETTRLLKEAVGIGALGKLNAGRLRKEFEWILKEPDPVACLKALGGHLDS